MLDYWIMKSQGRDHQQEQSGPKPLIRGPQPPTAWGPEPEITVPSLKLSIGFRSFSVLAPLFGVFYLTTLEIPVFPLMSSEATGKLPYLIIINTTP